MATYTLQYPPVHNDTYVKATTHAAVDTWPYFATDPANSLIGAHSYTSWVSADSSVTNQRFHIDLGAAKIIRRIYYENYHTTGLSTNRGIENFTFWGSNIATAFAELTYGTDTNWTQLVIGQSTFDQHIAANQADPKYILVTNGSKYRYYAFKCADNYGDANYMGVRRISLMTQDGYLLGNGIGIGNPYIF